METVLERSKKIIIPTFTPVKQQKEVLTYEILQQHKHKQQRLIADGIIEKPKIMDNVFTLEQEREFNKGITSDDIFRKYNIL